MHNRVVGGGLVLAVAYSNLIWSECGVYQLDVREHKNFTQLVVEYKSMLILEIW